MRKYILFILKLSIGLSGMYLMSYSIYFSKDIYELISGFLITIFGGTLFLNKD